MKWAVAVVVVCLGSGCSGQSSSDGPDAGSTDGGEIVPPDASVGGVYGGERPPDVYLPDNHSLDQTWPLVLVLHGYTANAQFMNGYLGISERVTSRGFVAVIPEGTIDQGGARFWNASNTCCDFYGSGVDDLGYLRNLIEEAVPRFGVDPDRVVVMGHSNGGFMAYRLACDASDVVSGIVSIAGLTQNSPARCTDGEPVDVLHVHGTQDTTIPFGGNSTTPGAAETTRRWRARNGCEATPEAGANRDVVASISGSETTVESARGCESGAVELWTLEGAPHTPSFTPDFTDQALEHHNL